MKFFVALVLTALLAFIAGLYTPWWSIAIVGVAVGLLVVQKPAISFLASFSGAFFLWAGLAWWMDSDNESLLASKIGELLGVGSNAFALVLITGIVGGLVAGFGALTGHFLVSRKNNS